LQVLGAVVQVEVANKVGKRPDFTASFCDGTVIVEAVSPIVNAHAGNVARFRIPLLNFIQSHMPRGYRIGVSKLPQIAPGGSLKQFKHAVLQLLSQLPAPTDSTHLRLETTIPTGTIRLDCFPHASDSTTLLWEPVLAACDNTQSRILHAVRKKRKQVRDSGTSVILAVHAGGVVSDLDDFDEAVFGHTFSRIDSDANVVEVGFKADGEFGIVRPAPPTYAALLAFTSLGFAGGSPPVLYRHPRFQNRLPVAFDQLATRFLNLESNSICNVPSKLDVMAQLNFVQV
jgi:hypothetical protein